MDAHPVAHDTAMPVAQPDGASRPDAPAQAVAEPATPRALWPTFMRRTLAEDALRQERGLRHGG